MTIEKEFDVNICRTSFSFANVKVKTNSLDEARERALNEAGDHSYSEKDADYTIEGITPMATTAPSMVKTIEAAIEAAIGSPPNIVAKKTQDTNQVELKGVSAARSKNKPK